MNKKETIAKVSQLSGIEYSDCCKVIKALEQVLNEELENSKGVGNAFDKVYKIMGIFKKQ